MVWYGCELALQLSNWYVGTDQILLAKQVTRSYSKALGSVPSIKPYLSGGVEHAFYATRWLRVFLIEPEILEGMTKITWNVAKTALRTDAYNFLYKVVYFNWC